MMSVFLIEKHKLFLPLKDDAALFSDAAFLWDLNESTLGKAISYGKLGKQRIVSIDAMKREYGEPVYG